MMSQGIEPISTLSKKEQKILDSHREIEWLKRQIQDIESKLEPLIPEPEIPDTLTADDLEQLRQRIDEQRGQLLEMGTYIFQKEQIQNTMDSQHYTSKALYPSNDNQETSSIKKSTQKLIEERDDIMLEMVRTYNELKRYRREMTELQKSADELGIENRKLFGSIKENKERTKEDRLECIGLIERLTEVEQHVETTRRVLQNLITESHLDWSRSERWANVMIRIGDDFEIFNKDGFGNDSGIDNDLDTDIMTNPESWQQ